MSNITAIAIVISGSSVFGLIPFIFPASLKRIPSLLYIKTDRTYLFVIRSEVYYN